MRILLACCFPLVLPQLCLAQEPTHDRSTRQIAESMVSASGPLRARASADITPAAWRPPRPLAGTYADPQARDRFTRHTYGWPVWSGCGFFARAPYCRWYSWRGCW